jgi:hypothetical protein
VKYTDGAKFAPNAGVKFNPELTTLMLLASPVAL